MAARGAASVFCVVASLLALLLCGAHAQAAGTPIPHGTLELIAEKPSIDLPKIDEQPIDKQPIDKQPTDKPGLAAGRTFDLGLHFQLEKGWHIYWINPGDSGEQPRVQWQLPAGLTAGEIQWPTPKRLETSSIVDFGYEGDVLLIVPVRADARLAAQVTARIGVEVRLLVCSHEMCVPGKAELSLTLPIKSQPPASDPNTVGLFAATRKSLPRPAPRDWKFSVSDAKDSFVLTAKLGHPIAAQQITQAFFFPLAESQIENAAPQKLQTTPIGLRLTLKKSDRLLHPIDHLKGVLVISSLLVSSNVRRFFEDSFMIDAPIGKSVVPRGNSASAIRAVQ